MSTAFLLASLFEFISFELVSMYVCIWRRLCFISCVDLRVFLFWLAFFPRACIGLCVSLHLFAFALNTIKAISSVCCRIYTTTCSHAESPRGLFYTLAC